jgi:hypothetical protein
MDEPVIEQEVGVPSEEMDDLISDYAPEVETPVEVGEGEPTIPVPDDTNPPGRDLDDITPPTPPVTEVVTTPETPTTEPVVEESELDVLKKQNEELMRMLAEVSKQVLPTLPVPAKEKSYEEQLAEFQAKHAPQPIPGVVVAAPNQAAPTGSGFQPLAFVTSAEDYEAKCQTPEAFNNLLNSVYVKAVETVMQTLPTVVQGVTRQELTMATLLNSFWGENPDLAGREQVVGLVAQTIQSNHPEYTPKQIFEALGLEVRKIIPRSIGAVAQPARQPGIPVVRGNARQPARAPVSQSQKEILDLLEFEDE